MAYVRSKGGNKRGGTYYYLVSCVREGGKVRQRTLAYLGAYPTVDAALQGIPAEVARLQAFAVKFTQGAEAKRAQCIPAWLERSGGEVPRPGTHGSANFRRICSKYWDCVHYAASYEGRARELSERLAKLQELRASGAA